MEDEVQEKAGGKRWKDKWGNRWNDRWKWMEGQVDVVERMKRQTARKLGKTGRNS